VPSISETCFAAQIALREMDNPSLLVALDYLDLFARYPGCAEGAVDPNRSSPRGEWRRGDDGALPILFESRAGQ
jgi:hypothetical protein